MPRPARSASQEYWRPADPATARIAGPMLAEGLCLDCGAEYATSARFCHLCGKERNRRPSAPPSPLTFPDYFDVTVIRRHYGLSISSVVLFIAGIVCLVVACSIGLLHKTETPVQWQAVQFWRVEWLWERLPQCWGEFF